MAVLRGTSGAWVRGITVRVGASGGGLIELGKQGVVVSDQVVRDLNIPVMQSALDLLDTVYAIADKLGVGPEVREAVLSIRTAEYAGMVATQVVGQAGASAAAAVFTGIGGVAALGAAFVVGSILSGLFSGGDEEAEYAARKRAQAAVLHLRDRLTLEGFAAEQDQIAKDEGLLAMIPWGDPSAHKAAAARAQKLAAFYRAADAQLSKGERDLFESLSNLARWQSALVQYGKLAQSKKDAIDVMFGTTEPRLPWQLKAPMAAEVEELEKLTAAVEKERTKPSSAWPVLFVGAVAATAAAIAFPAAAGAVAEKAVSVSSSLYRKARGLV